MADLKEFYRYCEELETLLKLETALIAVEMLETDADIQEGASRPKKYSGKHYAQCQVFALSMCDRFTVATFKQDNWSPPRPSDGLRPSTAAGHPQKII